MVTLPPAASTPLFTDSATVEGEVSRWTKKDDSKEHFTFGDMAVHRVYNDCDFGRRHWGTGRRCSKVGWCRFWLRRGRRV